ncbi:MAG: hypothetical protein IJZ87_02490 [Bacteroidales bacterium]|nr:hypothetical protein [Bacteroidales bacterium]
MKNKLVFMSLMMFFLLLNSCKKDESILSNEILGQENIDYGNSKSSSNEGMIVLGNRLNDPYKFENMLTARNQLANERNDNNTPTINITHRYMRYKPTNEEDLDLLKADTNLLLWDYPLHYEITNAGTYYHDPSIADSLPTWQYFVIPIDYQLPALPSRCELIYNLYIPDDNNSNTFYDDLEERAYLITGNLASGETMKNKEWTPSAVIKAYDDIIGRYIPIQGVKVTARRFTKARTGITNANGYCEVNGTFKNSVNYSIKWERAYWDIRNGAILQAYYNGPNKDGQWALNIPKGDKSLMFATIHRAAFKFYYGNSLGVRRPILNIGKTKIAYFDDDASWGTGCCWGTWDITSIVPNTMIAYPKSTPTNKVFSTTIHELGHQSHLITLGQNLYFNLHKEIHESWADAIEWRLTNHHYNDELGCIYNHPSNQSWHPGNLANGKTSCYTPLFIDLMDNYDQGLNNSTYPDDRIFGYSISYIQNTIIPVGRSLETVFTILDLNRPNGVNGDDIRMLMQKYWNQDYSR